MLSENVRRVVDLGVLVIDAMARYGRDGFADGDVLITNQQAIAGHHLNNVVIYMPVFVDAEIVCFSMVRAHWIDVGGLRTGFGATVRMSDPWTEGWQPDQLKIHEAGVPNEKHEFDSVDVALNLVPADTRAKISMARGWGRGSSGEREPECVQRDVREGLVSIEAAECEYRVLVDPETVEADEEATSGRRHELARRATRWDRRFKLHNEQRGDR